jgi:cohesin complex subunit SCC1
MAAHMERRLKRKQIDGTDIGVSVDSIMGLDVPLALRLSAVLMLGVVRVHSRQVGYLYNDCNEAVVAFQKVRHALFRRSGRLRTPAGGVRACESSRVQPRLLCTHISRAPDATDVGLEFHC